MRKVINFLSVFSLMILGSTAIATASAQGMPVQEAPAHHAETPDFSDAQKEAFVEAYAKVNAIQQQYQSQLDPEMDESQMQAKANQANQQIENATDSQSNMDTGIYRQILVALETDPELLNEIQEMLQSQGM